MRKRRYLAWLLTFSILAIGTFSFMAYRFGGSSNRFLYEEKLFDDSYVHEIRIIISEEDHLDLLNRAAEKNDYVGTVEIDGEVFNDVQLSTKGASTLHDAVMQEDTHCYSLKLKFDYAGEGRSCYGLDSLHLNNNYSDKSKLRDHIAYEMFAALGVPSPLTSYAHVTVNGEDFGVYLAIEGIENSFLKRNGLSDAELYKPEGSWYAEFVAFQHRRVQAAIDSGSLGEYVQTYSLFDDVMEFFELYREANDLSENIVLYYGSDLKYTGDDPENYREIFDYSLKNCSKKDREKVITALKNLSEMNVLQAVEPDEVIAYFAANNIAINVDGLNNKHNFFLAERDGRLLLIPWDNNSSMPSAYLSEESERNYRSSVDDVMDVLNGGDNPIWVWITADEKWRAAYHETLEKLLSEYMESGRCEAEVDRVNEMLRPYIEKDTSNLCTLEEYDTEVSRVRDFLRQRAVDIRKELDGE